MEITPIRCQEILGEIHRERIRQHVAEGWSEQHDDTHVSGEMARAGACYALAAHLDTEHELNTIFTRYWPWDRKWWKPKDTRRNLIMAAALIVADIERIDRAHTKIATAAQAAVANR